MSKREAENTKLSLPVSESRDHIQGPVTAPVTLVEYRIHNLRIAPRPI
jgi:hypothetical protein